MNDTHDYFDVNHLRGGAQPDDVAEKQSDTEGVPKIAQRLFLAALVLLPFVFVPVTGWSATVGKVLIVALLCMLAGAIAFGSVRTRTLVFPKTYSAILLGVLTMLVLSTVFSDALPESLFGAALGVGTFFTTALGIGIAFITPLILTSRTQLVGALTAVFSGGALLALFHVVRFMFGTEVFSFGYFPQPVSTPAGTWNDLGVFFGAMYLVALTAVTLGRIPDRLRNLLTLVLIGSLSFVVVVNFQLLSFVLALATLVLLIVSAMTQRNQVLFPALGSLIGLAALALLAVPAGSFLGNTLGATYTEIRPTWGNTQEILGSSLADIKNLTLGSGPNTFTYAWQANRTEDIIASNAWAIDFSFATGILPTFAVTLGVLTTMLLIWFACYLTREVLRVTRGNVGDTLAATVALSSGVGAIFLWIFALIEVQSSMVFLLMFVLSGIAMAAVVNLGRVETVHVSSTTRFGAFSGIVGATLCLVFVAGSLLVGTSRTLYGQGVVEANTAEAPAELASAQEKVILASLLEHNDAFARTATELGLVRIQELLARDNTDERDVSAFREVVQVTQSSAQRAQNINPRNFLNYVNAGLVYETLGLLNVENALDVAAERYARAQELNATNPELLLIQARLEQLRENPEEAFALVEEAIDMKSNYEDAYLLRADLALMNDEVEAAIGHLQAGIEAAPGGSRLPYQLGLIYYAEGDYTAAISSLTDALIEAPNHANARYFRALSYVYGTDNTAQALEDLRDVREDNPDNEVLASVIANIETGEDPLAGLGDEEDALPSADEESGVPETNVEAADDLETREEGAVENGSIPTEEGSTEE